MATSNANQIRTGLIALCRRVVEERLRSAEEAIRLAQESANQEGKSSAGDKYETGRAMAQLEIENASGQLADARKLKQAIDSVSVSEPSVSIRLGSLAYTNQENYFLSIPAGKLELDGTIWYAISPASPLGASLMGMKAGDTITINKKEITIRVVA